MKIIQKTVRVKINKKHTYCDYNYDINLFFTDKLTYNSLYDCIYIYTIYINCN